MYKGKGKKADVWVSVVIYTLIGITAIGLILVALQPRINEARDGITIKQTIEAMHNFDSALRSTLIAPGNKRVLELKLGEGEMQIDSENDMIVWSMKSSRKYSEPGFEIREGNIISLTEVGNPWKVTLKLKYDGLADLTYNGQQQTRILQKAGKSYSLSIENLGSVPGQVPAVDINQRA